MAWTTPRTWLAGEKPSAATYNTHIRDNFKAIGDQWIAYSPSWIGATTNPVIGNGSIQGFYAQAGKLTFFKVHIVIGSTTTIGSGIYTITFPFTALTPWNPGISGDWVDSSVSFTPYAMIGKSVATNAFRMVNGTTYGSNAGPFVLAVNDEINMGGIYEAA